MGAAFQGGPLLNSSGEVLASASRTYAPLGFSPEAVFFGVPIRNSCLEVIQLPRPQHAAGLTERQLSRPPRVVVVLSGTVDDVVVGSGRWVTGGASASGGPGSST